MPSVQPVWLESMFLKASDGAIQSPTKELGKKVAALHIQAEDALYTDSPEQRLALMTEINSALKAFDEGEGADNNGPNRP